MNPIKSGPELCSEIFAQQLNIILCIQKYLSKLVGSPMSIFALLLRANHKSDGKVKLENNFSIVFNMYI